jgi:16S rRNA (cytosine1402-N4)-methyltransferase
VLPEETVELLSGGFRVFGNENGQDILMIDSTLGEGGHSEAFLTKFPCINVIGIDADENILAVAKDRLAHFGNRVSFFHGWSDDFFALYPTNAAANAASARPDIILIDLGVSLFHYRKGGRGFSFLSDEVLDMRIDRGRGEAAHVILNKKSEKEIADLLFNNAQERYSRRIARAIVKRRAECPVTTAKQLAELVFGAYPARERGGRRGHPRVHPATKTFQALRIAVNDELSRLPALLERAFSVLKLGGRMGVITFHSLEDRIVKNFFREGAKDCVCPPSAPICNCRGHRLMRLITHKAVAPSEAAAADNPPSRSAKLRVIEKVSEE